MDISEFNVDKSKGEVMWSYDDNQISVHCESLRHAMQDETVNLVLILQRAKNSMGKLIGYSADGRKKFEVNPPDGYSFCYFDGDKVVCSRHNKPKEDKWRDWHFLVNPETGELTRGAPSK